MMIGKIENFSFLQIVIYLDTFWTWQKRKTESLSRTITSAICMMSLRMSLIGDYCRKETFTNPSMNIKFLGSL